jgi:hypothetical protein
MGENPVRPSLFLAFSSCFQSRVPWDGSAKLVVYSI